MNQIRYIEKTRTFWKPRTIPGFLSDEKTVKDSTKFYIITKLIPNYIILTDVFIVLLKHLLGYTSWSISRLATEKKTKRLNAKNLCLKSESIFKSMPKKKRDKKYKLSHSYTNPLLHNLHCAIMDYYYHSGNFYFLSRFLFGIDLNIDSLFKHKFFAFIYI